jgi:TRAP-type C4-dicarboxylate transport system permease small subunit
MIWSRLAASYALWQGEQLGMEFVVKLLPEGGRRAVRILANVLCIGFLAVIAYQGFVWMMPQQLDQISPSLGITMAIPYAAIPVSAVLMIWVEILFIWRELRGRETSREPGTNRPLREACPAMVLQTVSALFVLTMISGMPISFAIGSDGARRLPPRHAGIPLVVIL